MLPSGVPPALHRCGPAREAQPADLQWSPRRLCPRAAPHTPTILRVSLSPSRRRVSRWAQGITVDSRDKRSAQHRNTTGDTGRLCAPGSSHGGAWNSERAAPYLPAGSAAGRPTKNHRLLPRRTCCSARRQLSHPCPYPPFSGRKQGAGVGCLAKGCWGGVLGILPAPCPSTLLCDRVLEQGAGEL